MLEPLLLTDKNKHEINAFIDKWKNIVDSVEIQKKVIPHSAFKEANGQQNQKSIVKDYDYENLGANDYLV